MPQPPERRKQKSTRWSALGVERRCMNRALASTAPNQNRPKYVVDDLLHAPYDWAASSAPQFTQMGGWIMRSRITGATLTVAILFLTGACATSEDWKVWREHSTHFASGEHGFFSLRNNRDGSDPRVYRSDIEDARNQNWWGNYVINVSPNQILQN
jgi:hypothetical protein